MEEDNVGDIFKSMQHDTQNSVEESSVGIQYKDVNFNAKICLNGNILACSSMNESEALVPLVFIMERATVKKIEPQNGHIDAHSCMLCFLDPADNLTLSFTSEALREKWMIKFATCSHEMALAELDEIAYKFYTMTSTEETTNETVQAASFQNFYLTSPHKVTHNFAISQQNNLPSRRVVFDEILWESKLSLILPIELLKLYRKWMTDFCGLLESRHQACPAFLIPALHELLRNVRENMETYEQCYEFLQNYSGPSFRKSTEKFRVAFGPVPTNLHVQSFGIPNEKVKEVITSGTVSAIPLRFQNGGLHKIINQLEVDPMYQDGQFWNKRHVIIDLKKSIGELSHKLDVEWKIANFGKPDKICLELNSGIKQVYERLKDTLRCVNGAERVADFLLEEERKKMATGAKVDSKIVDSLQNQMDNLEAMLISLNTKIAVIDTLNDAQAERQTYEKSARDAMSTCLDMLLSLADSLLEAQLFGLVMALHKPATAHQYLHVQLRSDFVLSQAVTTAATAIMNKVHRGWNLQNGQACDMLLVVFSFLSVYGDERGMMEDAWEAWKMMEARVSFRLVRAPSAVCRTCIPMVTGQRAQILVSIPLPHEVFDALPQQLREKSSFKVRTTFFNIGVNHEATLGQSFGGSVLESSVNQEAADRLNAYANSVEASAQAREAVMELVNTVTSEPSRKNLSVFEWAMAACEQLEGRAVVCCKSGKDRTGMAVTLEQGRALRQTCGLNSAQVSEVVASLRRDGTRRENCRKNVGKPVYSFSPFQMHFLPVSFRPPTGTFAKNVAS